MMPAAAASPEDVKRGNESHGGEGEKSQDHPPGAELSSGKGQERKRGESFADGERRERLRLVGAQIASHGHADLLENERAEEEGRVENREESRRDWELERPRDGESRKEERSS